MLVAKDCFHAQLAFGQPVLRSAWQASWLSPMLLGPKGLRGAARLTLARHWLTWGDRAHYYHLLLIFLLILGFVSKSE